MTEIARDDGAKVEADADQKVGPHAELFAGLDARVKAMRDERAARVNAAFIAARLKKKQLSFG